MSRSGGRLSLAWQDIDTVPATLAGRGAESVTELDLSNNQFRNLQSIEPFRRLRVLILDHNLLESTVRFPPLPSLETLWVNHNQISNLVMFIEHVAFMFPKLTHLSMLDNKACPNYFNGGSPEQYQDYRLFVISRLRHLKTLDDLKVRPEELADSARIYGAFKPPSVVRGEDVDVDVLKAKAPVLKIRRKHNGTVRRPHVPPPEGPPFLPSPGDIERKSKSAPKETTTQTLSPSNPPLVGEEDDEWSDDDVDLADPGIRAYVESSAAARS